MNEQERKAWEELVGTVDKNNPMGLSKAGHAILAAGVGIGYGVGWKHALMAVSECQIRGRR